MFVFLKLGGSLITDKSRPYTPRLERLDDLASQIAKARQDFPSLRLLLGHGSGSFGHQAASNLGTRQGVSGAEAWRGFAEVWFQASTLNRIVIEALRRAGLPAVTLSPFASVRAEDGGVKQWDPSPLQACLEAGLLPVIHGDVILDVTRGGTILSTEDLFAYLATRLKPQRILLAGLEQGVWQDFPARTRVIPVLTRRNLPKDLGSALETDVTGGMRAKVVQVLDTVEHLPSLEGLIFSGEQPGNIYRALAGENPGTRITAGEV